MGSDRQQVHGGLDDGDRGAATGVYLASIAICSLTLGWLVNRIYAWAGLGSAFGPPLLLALHWRRTSWAGVLAGFLTGTVTVVGSVPSVWTEPSGSVASTMLMTVLPAGTVAL